MNNIPAVLNIIIPIDNNIERILSYISCIFYIFMLSIMLIICYTAELLIK